MKRGLKQLQTPRNGIQYITGPETREELSPFVFFDAGTMMRNDNGLFIGMHPHSGIGIITYFEGANLVHDDSGKNDNMIPDGGVQWIRAGGGVWHQENYVKKNEVKTEGWPLTIHQLWMQLPPELEESEVEYQNIKPEDLPQVDNVKVIAGTYKNVTSPLKVPYQMTYLDVQLNKGDVFVFNTPETQTTGFIFPREGTLKLHGADVPSGHLSILENNEGLIKVIANSNAKFVLLMAEPQNYPSVTYGGSIHTNEKALDRSIKRIREIKS